MFNIEVNKNELDTILIALRDSEERITRQMKHLKCNYSDLPPNLKFLWKDEKTYKEYSNNAIQECLKQLNEINKLREKIAQI